MAQRQTIQGYVDENTSYSYQMPFGGYVNQAAVGPAATSYQITGPTSGNDTQPSAVFTSSAAGSTNAMVTVSDGAGGTFSPSATFAAKGGSFTYTPNGAGTKTLTFTNDGGLTNQAPLTYQAVAYTPPPTVSLTNQDGPDGQSITFYLSTTTADTVSATITAAGGEAVTQTQSNVAVTSNSAVVTFNNIAPGDYTVSITATGGGGSTTISGNNFTIIALDGGGGINFETPSAPVIGTAVAKNSAVEVHFTAPASSGSSEITHYQATLSTGESATGTSSPILVNASNGTARTATVVAYNEVGPSPASEPSNSVTPFGVSVTLDFVGQTGAPIPSGTVMTIIWFDQAVPSTLIAPIWKGSVTTTGAAQVVNIPGSSLNTGGTGWIIATDSDGNPNTAHRAFSGPMTVQ